MPKSIVAGVAGSVRIDRLKLHQLRVAEDHGKRLDYTSQKRRIREADPVTSTGLDIMALYEQHISGLHVPGGNTKALHMICQFPTDLVDPARSDWMLDEARKFATKVFGDRAIFADRLDKDEKGEHVVDLFLAPRYTKQTKHTEKEAVSISKHLKELGIKHDTRDETARAKVGKTGKTAGEDPNLFYQGRALQIAWFEYLRDDAGLDKVQRGSLKWTLGDDWVPAEVLDIQRRQEAVEEKEAAAQQQAQAAAEAEAEAQRKERAAAESKTKAMELIRQVRTVEAARDEQLKTRELNVIEREAAVAEAAQAAAMEAKDAADQRERAEALQVGIEAFADGDIIDAVEREGSRVLSFKDKETRDRLFPRIKPALQAVWMFVKKAVERLAALRREAAEDRRLAAIERVAAAELSRTAQRRIDDAVAERKAALEAATREANATAAALNLRNELGTLIAGGDLYQEGNNWFIDTGSEPAARLQRAKDATPQAELVVESYLTSFGKGLERKQRQLATEKLTEADIDAAAANMVTPELLKAVIERKLSPIDAGKAALAAAARGRNAGDVGR